MNFIQKFHNRFIKFFKKEKTNENSTKQVNTEVVEIEDFFEEQENVNEPSMKEFSYDFRTRASFRAQIFDTLTRRSTRRFERCSLNTKQSQMGFLGQIYKKSTEKQSRKSSSSSCLS